MKSIQPDAGSSFKLLHHLVQVNTFKWQYPYYPEYEIVCVFEGSSGRHVGNDLSNYTDGDLVLIGSNIPHGVLTMRLSCRIWNVF